MVQAAGAGAAAAAGKACCVPLPPHLTASIHAAACCVLPLQFKLVG
jgi:hypothetical protein